MQSLRPRVSRKLFLMGIALMLLLGWMPNVNYAEAQAPAEGDTIKLLTAWDGDADGALGALFATGKGRAAALVEACRNPDEEVRAKAFVVLYFIGSPETPKCAALWNSKDQPVQMVMSDEPTSTELDDIERSFRRKPCEREGNCSDEECPIPDETDIYALILNGSARAVSLLKRAAAMTRACHQQETIGAELAEHAESLAREARSATHDLVLDGTNFESTLRQSAFFVAPEYRNNTDVKVLARSESDTRILAEISYRCGMLCGGGYYIVLKKNAKGSWDYVIITRAWIS